MNDALPSRRWLARGAVILVIISLLAPAGIAAVAGTGDDADLASGTVTDPANGSTVVGIQGFHFKDRGAEKKPARLVSADENADTEWVHTGIEDDVSWFYDVDPLDNGNLLVVSTKPAHTLVYEYNPDTEEAVWVERLDTDDTHDVDMMENGDLVVADIRNWENGTSEDRIFVYNRSTDEITWEWQFKDHYPENTDGGYNEDWTHVNDVDVIDEHRLLLSPRNFDQVVILNRTTGQIEDRLGSDGDHDTLFEQHNPDYLESENGTPTILVADSENDRIVEYAKEGGNWTLTWELGGPGQLNWPRDADRLPNGNTLVTDSLNHRVIEVTPQGEIVWEYYATWGPYDAERVAHGGSSNGPTVADMNASGSYDVTGSAGLQPGTGEGKTFAAQVESTFAGTPLADSASEFAATWSHVTPWIRPTWMSGWDLFFTALAALALLGWGIAEVVYQRRRIVGRARSVAGSR
ncbi:Arylsulfotransferase (ASST) [Halogranum amylolyticum]|uniref:Arylsulfotransferase (ASST) n=1 Tax=Halogranum amylolyticum TaxID=660520 RepID=A0A1H8QHL9_9EURY|nr:ArsR family transcriptional regulator [Halogranum amylolyticum]SEO53709.1 Arylsulfotransferase (ASST) [Halogranum amylolyticum]